jgi:hypothetical protein
VFGEERASKSINPYIFITNNAQKKGPLKFLILSSLARKYKGGREKAKRQLTPLRLQNKKINIQQRSN